MFSIFFYINICFTSLRSGTDDFLSEFCQDNFILNIKNLLFCRAFLLEQPASLLYTVQSAFDFGFTNVTWERLQCIWHIFQEFEINFFIYLFFLSLIPPLWKVLERLLVLRLFSHMVFWACHHFIKFYHFYRHWRGAVEFFFLSWKIWVN